MYPRSFFCDEAKIKQRTPFKKELLEIGEEAIWESWFTSFFSFKMSFPNCLKYQIYYLRNYNSIEFFLKQNLKMFFHLAAL